MVVLRFRPTGAHCRRSRLAATRVTLQRVPCSRSAHMPRGICRLTPGFAYGEPAKPLPPSVLRPGPAPNARLRARPPAARGHAHARHSGMQPLKLHDALRRVAGPCVVVQSRHRSSGARVAHTSRQGKREATAARRSRRAPGRPSRGEPVKALRRVKGPCVVVQSLRRSSGALVARASRQARREATAAGEKSRSTDLGTTPGRCRDQCRGDLG